MEEIREQVRKKYAAAITGAQSCCGPDRSSNPVTGNLYQTGELDGLPEDLVASSFGCGNPTALATLYAGETVLDLGSGAAWMYCSRPNGSALPAKPTAWI
jgi:hypothetical protein